MMPLKINRIISLLLLFLFIACEELEIDPDNPFEADISEQIPEITSLDQNINGSTASFNWEGNKFAFSYSFRLESQSYENPVGIYINWSVWSPDTLVILEDLDEGQYIFQVKSRFDEIEQSEPTTNNFEIDVISSPTLRIYPLSQTANIGDEIDVYLYFEEVPEELAVTGLHVDIKINAEEEGDFEFITNAYEQGGLISQFTGTTIYPVPSYSDGILSIDGVADENGIGLYGTGSIAKFSIRFFIPGTHTIKIEGESYFDIDGNPIGFGEPVSGLVMVEQ